MKVKKRVNHLNRTMKRRKAKRKNHQVNLKRQLLKDNPSWLKEEVSKGLREEVKVLLTLMFSRSSCNLVQSLFRRKSNKILMMILRQNPLTRTAHAIPVKM